MDRRSHGVPIRRDCVTAATADSSSILRMARRPGASGLGAGDGGERQIAPADGSATDTGFVHLKGRVDLP